MGDGRVLDGGWFGQWEGPPGLPRFVLDPRDDTDGADRVLPARGHDGLWHQIGNAGLTATAHAGGWVELWSTARGMVRITGPANRGGIVGRPVEIRGTTWRLGGAEWLHDDGQYVLRRRITTTPGSAPFLRIDVDVERHQPGPVGPVIYEEHWPGEPNHLLVGALMSPWVPPPVDYRLSERIAWSAMYAASASARAATLLARRLMSPRLVRPPQFDPELVAVITAPRWPTPPEPVTSAAWVDLHLPYLFVAFVDGDTDEAPWGHGPSLRVSLRPRDCSHVSFVVGLADRIDDIADLIEAARAVTPDATERNWSKLCQLELEDEPVLRREATWHASYLFGAQQPDAYFGHRYTSQGSAYGFVHGLQGAPRDYAISVVPLCFVDPPGARDQIRIMMRLTKPSGSMHYAHAGRGQCTSGGIHASPTDLPLFFLWALTEYVWSTGDAAILDEPEPFYPAERGLAATAAERVTLAFTTLRDRIGRGPTGLLRVGSGDWADPISAMVGDRHAFHRHGESGFNTAFAVYVLPRAASLIETHDPDGAAAMRIFASELRDAMESAWTGRWFLRGTDGRGGKIGRDHLFLDGQVWALIARIGSEEQRATLIAEITERCIEPSPIGATILDRPHPVRFGMLAPGWDCNGGVWAAINALLAWGLALHDPDLAWEVLHRQSLAAHARAYPHVWYGIWSGPDAYNAWFGSHAGETFIQPATPMAEYPVMNSNAHAGPLLALLRVLGIETSPEGVTVRHDGRPFQLETALGQFERLTSP